MSASTTQRFYFGDYALTYNKAGWALLHKDDGFVGSDRFPTGIGKIPYREGKSLLQFVEDAMAKGLGEKL